MVFVDLAAAVICFAGSCYPALIGANTPVGEYQIEQRATSSPGYGGDVLMFKEDVHMVYAVHRVITFNQRQRRIERLQLDLPAQARIITDGCINVMPEVYDKLVDCCVNDQLTIKE